MATDCNGLLPEDPYKDLSFLLWQIMKNWQRNKQKILDEFNITSSQIEILSSVFHLSHTGGSEEITQIVISNVTHIDPMTTSTVLRNLEKKGLINRKQSEIDTRARVVEITADGEDLVIKAILKVQSRKKNIEDHVDMNAMLEQLKILLDALIKISDLENKVDN